jgi:hypothetical protein
MSPSAGQTWGYSDSCGSTGSSGCNFVSQHGGDFPPAVEIHFREAQMTTVRRIVQIYVVDPDEAVPVDKALLHHDGPRLTDATDDELRYELNLPALLEKHNAYRAELELEPARIRDVKIEIVTMVRF